MEKNTNDVTEVSTQMDDASTSGPTEQELLDAVMKNSPIMEEDCTATRRRDRASRPG